MKPTNKVPITKTVAMPKDTNANGDIFGGWLLSQMDLAGCVECKRYFPGRYVTITIDKMVFSKPVNVMIIEKNGSIINIFFHKPSTTEF